MNDMNNTYHKDPKEKPMSDEDKFDPYLMEMHYEVSINANTDIMRVPGGWLYHKTSRSHVLTTTFVPEPKDT